ncbi:MAG: SH3 domain-containing protein [Deltaproteobacteria bacterium]|nr:SH3 domain-containing protein [Deltaproteobacteria bacterium]
MKRANRRWSALKKKLDQAILEVVQARAKVDSVASKAEAATNMAEAEVTLKSLTMSRSKQGKGSELDRAQYLLRLSNDEFQRKNYSGALYLAQQAKKCLMEYRTSQPALKKSASSDETAFAVPLPLRVIKRSNVRQGPGTDYKIIATLPPHSLVTGFIYKGSWVKVRSKNNIIGWIHQDLVKGL